MNLETFWADIFSKEPVKIIAAMDSLSEEEQQAVINHLQRMVTETGWTEGQRKNARSALDILQK